MRETKRGGACCARKTKGEGRHVRETRDGGAMRERREGVVCVCYTREFQKLVYEKFEYKLFSLFLHWVFRSTEIKSI